MDSRLLSAHRRLCEKKVLFRLALTSLPHVCLIALLLSGATSPGGVFSAVLISVLVIWWIERRASDLEINKMRSRTRLVDESDSNFGAIIQTVLRLGPRVSSQAIEVRTFDPDSPNARGAGWNAITKRGYSTPSVIVVSSGRYPMSSVALFGLAAHELSHLEKLNHNVLRALFVRMYVGNLICWLGFCNQLISNADLDFGRLLAVAVVSSAALALWIVQTTLADLWVLRAIEFRGDARGAELLGSHKPLLCLSVESICDAVGGSTKLPFVDVSRPTWFDRLRNGYNEHPLMAERILALASIGRAIPTTAVRYTAGTSP